MPTQSWSFRLTAAHMMDDLAASLYGDSAACLWEIVRNGIIACMPGNLWIPGKGKVHINLVNNHPLAAGGRALVILDLGSGFTKASMRRFCSLGRSLEDVRNGGKGSHSGAAQKCIGRFAAFALNKECYGGDPDTGFYILTRTAAKGPVTFIDMTPSEIEQNQRFQTDLLGETDSIVEPYGTIKGSFSAVVIPNPVFKNHVEIRNALQWRLPRKPEQMPNIKVGNKALHAPPLSSKLTMSTENGDIEIFIDRLSKHTEQTRGPGIWLTDKATGLPVARATALATRLPYPLWHHGLEGDIVVPDLLANQDTARGSLRAPYLRSAAWKRATSFFVGQVAERAKALLGDDDSFGRTGFDKHVLEIADLCAQIWGKPAASNNGVFCDLGATGPSKKRIHKSKPTAPGTSSSPSSGGEKSKPRRRSVPIKIGDKTFFLSKRELDPLLLAQVDQSNGEIIYINELGYNVLPRIAAARREHIILKLIEAVAQAEHPDDPVEVTLRVAEIRQKLLTKEGQASKRK